MKFRNLFFLEHVDVNGIVLARFEYPNLVTIEGKNYLLGAGFGAVTPITPWYIGLVNASPTPSYSESDTLASHAGWTELTSYTGNRQEWVEAAASGKSMGTTTVAEFTMSGTGSIIGTFLASAATGTSGTLWSVGSLPAAVDFIDSQVFRTGYTINL